MTVIVVHESLRYNGSCGLGQTVGWLLAATRRLFWLDALRRVVASNHLLRLILLAGELAQLCPPEVAEDEWRAELQDVTQQFTASCRHGRDLR